MLCYPLTVVDGYSRFLLSCTAYAGTSYEEARRGLEHLFLERGLPRRMRSDNGSPFASIGAGRLSRLNVWWLKLGIAVERIEPGRPQQNGRHERLHRTLKAETVRPPAGDRRRQQRRFDRFLVEYHQERPHEALGRELVGLVEVDEAIWQIWFGSVELALFDAANHVLWPLGSAASGPRRGTDLNAQGHGSYLPSPGA